MRLTIYFHEVEHDGDLEEYISDIERSGGIVLNKQINYDAETAKVDVDCTPEFPEKFKKTNAFDFSHLSN